MNSPSLLGRFAGSPLGALLLFLGCGALIWGWYQGDVSWWLALAAVGMAFRTLGAVGQLRRYNAWAAEWQAMGGDESQRPQKKHGRGWGFVTCAALLLVAIPVYQPQLKNTDAIPNHEAVAAALTWLWVVVFVFLMWKLVTLLGRTLIRSRASSKARRRAKAEAAPVAWLIERASSSPSRAAATRSLPEYSARLIGKV